MENLQWERERKIMDGWYEFVVTSFYQLCLLKIGYDNNGFKPNTQSIV